MKIKVYYLLAYDYEFFFTSVKQLYFHVDKIVIAVDKDFLTWSGNKFEIPMSFFEEVEKFDERNIIEFYWDKFYVEELTPMECESRERNMVLQKLGSGWKVQLDVDEYICNFELLVKFLKKYYYLTLFPKLTPIGFRGNLVTLFKKIEPGFLYIDNGETFPLITNQNKNTVARENTKIFQYSTSTKVIHQSWARKNAEIIDKIVNWGHRDDFDTEEYFKFWEDLNEENFYHYQNFHPISKKVWNKLMLVKAVDIDDFINKYKRENKQISIQSSFDLGQYLKSLVFRYIKNYYL